MKFVTIQSWLKKLYFKFAILVIIEAFLFKVDEEQCGATGTDSNLSEKVPPSETPGEEEKTVPVWSEKMSQSILAGLNFKIRAK